MLREGTTLWNPNERRAEPTPDPQPPAPEPDTVARRPDNGIRGIYHHGVVLPASRSRARETQNMFVNVSHMTMTAARRGDEESRTCYKCDQPGHLMGACQFLKLHPSTLQPMWCGAYETKCRMAYLAEHTYDSKYYEDATTQTTPREEVDGEAQTRITISRDLPGREPSDDDETVDDEPSREPSVMSVDSRTKKSRYEMEEEDWGAQSSRDLARLLWEKNAEAKRLKMYIEKVKDKEAEAEAEARLKEHVAQVMQQHAAERARADAKMEAQLEQLRKKFAEEKRRRR